MSSDRRYLESLVPPNIRQENFEIEWKASLRYDHDARQPGINKELTKVIHKAICGFANGRRDSGLILVGFHEKDGWKGIEFDDLNDRDGKVDKDRWTRNLMESLEANGAKLAIQQIEVKFYEYKRNITCAVIEVSKSPDLIEYGKDREIFVRAQGKNQKYVGQEEINNWKRNRNIGVAFRRGWATDQTDANFDSEIFSLEWEDNGMVREDSSDIPQKPGIYIYTCEIKERNKSLFFDSLKSIIYIGSSNVNIRERYDRHFPRPEFRSARYIYDNQLKFYYCVIDRENIINIKKWEGELIRFFGPSINEKNEGG